MCCFQSHEASVAIRRLASAKARRVDADPFAGCDAWPCLGKTDVFAQHALADSLIRSVRPQILLCTTIDEGARDCAWPQQTGISIACAVVVLPRPRSTVSACGLVKLRMCTVRPIQIQRDACCSRCCASFLGAPSGHRHCGPSSKAALQSVKLSPTCFLGCSLRPRHNERQQCG